MTRRSATASLRRSLLFVPGGERRKIEKSATSVADTILLDLEDAVAVDQKEEARRIVSDCLGMDDFAGREVAVRLNPPTSPFFQEDVAAVVEAGAGVLMLPKCESPEGLRAALEAIAAAGSATSKATGSASAVPAAGDGPRVLALVETALGIARADRLVPAEGGVDALCFGHVDFSSDMRLPVADASDGVALHARCALSIAARASGLTAIDTVFLDVRDDAGFESDARRASALGFGGKLCIHPRQAPIANDVFTPSPDEVEYARRILAARDEAEAAGRGVFAVDGKMVDAPVIAAQENVIERAEKAGVA